MMQRTNAKVKKNSNERTLQRKMLQRTNASTNDATMNYATRNVVITKACYNGQF